MSLAGANAPMPALFRATIELYRPALPPVSRSSPPPTSVVLASELSATVTFTSVIGPEAEMPAPFVAELKATVVLVSESVPVDPWSMPPPAASDVLLTTDEFETVIVPRLLMPPPWTVARFEPSVLSDIDTVPFA